MYFSCSCVTATLCWDGGTTGIVGWFTLSSSPSSISVDWDYNAANPSLSTINILQTLGFYCIGSATSSDGMSGTITPTTGCLYSGCEGDWTISG
jgi:hypothetical protein